VKEADCQRFHAVGRELGDDLPSPVLVEGAQDRAVGQEPLADLATEASWHERRRRIDEEIVHVVAAFVADLERVAEALGGEERRPRPLALDEGIGRERGAVDDRPNGARRDPRLVEKHRDALFDAVRRILRRGEDLAYARDPRRLVDDDEIGERAADVDAKPGRHGVEFTTGVGRGR